MELGGGGHAGGWTLACSLRCLAAIVWCPPSLIQSCVLIVNQLLVNQFFPPPNWKRSSINITYILSFYSSLDGFKVLASTNLTTDLKKEKKNNRKQTKKQQPTLSMTCLVPVTGAVAVPSVLQANVICVVAYLSAHIHSNCGVAAWHGTSTVWPCWYISISFIT